MTLPTPTPGVETTYILRMRSEDVEFSAIPCGTVTRPTSPVMQVMMSPMEAIIFIYHDHLICRHVQRVHETSERHRPPRTSGTNTRGPRGGSKRCERAAYRPFGSALTVKWVIWA
jgi:hypothetical protein